MVRERGDTIVWEEVEGLGGLGPHGEGEGDTIVWEEVEGLGGLGPHGEGERGHNSLGGGGGTRGAGSLW